MPFKMELMVIVHQMPLRPSSPESHMAKGIRKAVREMEIRLGGIVLPSPLNAPAVVISIHMKYSESAKMRK